MAYKNTNYSSRIDWQTGSNFMYKYTSYAPTAIRVLTHFWVQIARVFPHLFQTISFIFQTQGYNPNHMTRAEIIILIYKNKVEKSVFCLFLLQTFRNASKIS